MTDASLTRTQKRQIQRYPREARRLPAHPQTFGHYEVGLPQDALAAFSRVDVIRSKGTVAPADHPNGRKRATKWQAAPGVAAFVAEKIDPQTWTPCGHSTGVRTVRSGTVYTCTDNDCEVRFSRRVAEAVITDDPLPAADREVIEA
jgi:hypothetical protein